MDKYQTNSRQVTQTAFDARQEHAQQVRMGSAPRTASLENMNIGERMAGWDSINNDLIDLADKYEKLDVNFHNLIGSDRIYDIGDALSIAFYTVLRRKGKIREIRSEALKEKGNGIENLANMMAEVVGTQYEMTKQGVSDGLDVRQAIISEMRRLDRKNIDSLRSGLYTGADEAAAQQEVARLTTELSEIDDVLQQYQADISAARAEGDIPKVNTLSDEVSQVLDLKYSVLDGKLAAEGTVSDIRRAVLDAAEGVQSAQGALAAAQASYEIVEALLDGMYALQIKYKHAQEDMIPQLKIQAVTTTLAKQAIGQNDLLKRLGNISSRLVDANAVGVKYVGRLAADLLKAQIYNPEHMESARQDVRSFRQDLAVDLKDWAESVLVPSRSDPTGAAAPAAYGRHK